MSSTLWFATGSDLSWLQNTAMERALRLAQVVLLGAVAYFAALWLLGFRLRDFARQGEE
jgi:putative peptidoglycan lipid II flippase